MPRRSRAKRCSSPARSISTRTTRSLSRSSERGVFVMRCLTVPLALAAFAAAALLSRGAARAVELTIVPVQTALAHHAVTTKNPAAQQAFDEGLTLIYAFNRDESAKRFQHAAELDPALAMAWWSVAIAEGPNHNYGMTPARIQTANAVLAKAKKLADGASPEERRYI